MNQRYKMVIPEEKIIEIYNNEYLNGISARQLSIKYNTSLGYFSRWFNKLGLETFRNDIQSRKYTFNENYFKKIDTEEKAYWLGFIYADGYIGISSNGNKILGIALSSVDKSHLEKFRYCMESDQPIRTYKQNGGYSHDTNYCRIIFPSKILTDDLISKGVVEHKTNYLKFPNEDILPQELQKHFIRGYFDGDGSVWKSKSSGANYPQYSISFLETDDFLSKIQDILFENNLIHRRYSLNKRKEGQIVSNFKYGGNKQSEKTMRFLYEDSNMYLDRKYQIYLELLKLNEEIDMQQKE